MKVRIFSLTQYLDEALKRAEYSRDDDGVVVAKVAKASGFYAQGDSFEDARANLRDVIEGNVLLALQLGLRIPRIAGIEVAERRIDNTRRHGANHPAQGRRRHP